MKLKTIFIIFLIAIGLTIVGLPFGVKDIESGYPGALGVDHHVFVTFLSREIIDLGHYGYPGGELNGYILAFSLNGIFAYLIALILLPKFK